MMVLILYLYMFILPIDVPIQEQQEYITYNGYTEIKIRGSPQIPLEINNKPVIITDVGLIPLRKQMNASCATTSLAMLMDWLDQPYRTQEFYDQCAQRSKDKGAYLYQLKMCADKMGISTTVKEDYDINKLKTGDIVVYDIRQTNISLHASVIDQVSFCEKLNQNIIRIANPWNIYHEYTTNEFTEIYTGKALIINF